MFRGSLKVMAAVFIAGAVMIGFADGASADSGVSAAVAVTVAHNQKSTPSASDPLVRQVASVLKAGGTVDLQDQGQTVLTARLEGNTLRATSPLVNNVTAPSGHAHVDYSWCTYATAAAILSVGAAVILTIVAAGLVVGATEITIIGITLTPGAWAAIAGAMGAWGALLAAVSQYIC